MAIAFLSEDLVVLLMVLIHHQAPALSHHWDEILGFCLEHSGPRSDLPILGLGLVESTQVIAVSRSEMPTFVPQVDSVDRHHAFLVPLVVGLALTFVAAGFQWVSILPKAEIDPCLSKAEIDPCVSKAEIDPCQAEIDRC